MWEYLTGSLCVLCRQSTSGAYARRQLCRWCLADLPWLDGPDLPCAPDSPIERQIAPLAYEGSARRWVLEAKREGGLVAARVLGTLLADAVEEAYPAGSVRPTHLVPVPLSLRRLLKRGHNQAILIGAPVARRLGIPLHRLAARRRRHTPPQPGLGRSARAANVVGAFESRRRWHGALVAIVDDVVTTGATADALARALLDAGAGAVHLWCATRAMTA
jgi:ComF family protein